MEMTNIIGMDWREMFEKLCMNYNIRLRAVDMCRAVLPSLRSVGGR